MHVPFFTTLYTFVCSFLLARGVAIGDKVPTTYLDGAAAASPSESDMLFGLLVSTPHKGAYDKGLRIEMVLFTEFAEFFDKAKEMFTASPTYVSPFTCPRGAGFRCPLPRWVASYVR